MRIEEQAPIIGAAFVGGMAQSWFIKKYPEWSWGISLGLIAGGAYIGTRTGILEKVGIGLAAAGASGLGTALVPIEAGTTSPMHTREMLNESIQVRRQLPAGRGARTGARVPEFEQVREY
jgi:uncharacterized RmlC-like cupin family protein